MKYKLLYASVILNIILIIVGVYLFKPFLLKKPTLPSFSPSQLLPVKPAPEGVLTVGEYNDNPVVNETITVRGLIMQGQAMCTLKGCSIENPCCNSCRGIVILVDQKNKDFQMPRLTTNDENIDLTCSGNECGIECKGPLKPGSVYDIVGIVQEETKYEPSNQQPYTIQSFLITSFEKVK